MHKSERLIKLTMMSHTSYIKGIETSSSIMIELTKIIIINFLNKTALKCIASYAASLYTLNCYTAL